MSDDYDPAYSEMFHNTPVFLYRTAPDGTILRTNAAAADFFGVADADELVGQNAADYYDDPSLRGRSIQGPDANGIISHVVRLRRKDGRAFWALDRSRAVKDDDGDLTHYDGCIIDITERVNQELALHVSERLYREIVDNASDIIFTYDRDGAFTSVNHRGTEILGYSAQEFLGMNVLDVVDPQWRDKATHLAASGTGRALGDQEAFQILCRAKDGRRVWLDISSRTISERDSVVGVQAIARDITKRRRQELEEQLVQDLSRAIGEADDMDHAMAEVLRLICEATGWAYGEAWLLGPEGRYTRCPSWYGADDKLGRLEHMSRSLDFEAGFGMPGRAVAKKQAVWQPVLADDPEFRRAAAASAYGLTAGMAVPVVLGDDVPAVLVFMLKPGQKGEISGSVVASAADKLGAMIERLRLTEELETQSVLLQAQIEGSEEGILVVSSDGDILTANRRFIELSGADPTEGLAKIRQDGDFRSSVQHMVIDREADASDVVDVNGRRLRRRSRRIIGPDDQLVGRVWYFSEEARAA